MGRIHVSGSRNNVYVVSSKPKQKIIPNEGAAKVANITTIPSAQVPPTVSTHPSRVTANPAVSTTPAANVTPAENAPLTREQRIKNLLSDIIVALGLILLAVGVCVLAAHAVGGAPIDSNQLQTIIMCGFGLIAGGLSLPNTDYKGSMTIGGGNLPFSFNIQSQK